MLKVDVPERISREDLCAAIRLLGFDPFEVSRCCALSINADEVSAHVFERDDHGKLIVDPDRNEVRTRHVVVRITDEAD